MKTKFLVPLTFCSMLLSLASAQSVPISSSASKAPQISKHLSAKDDITRIGHRNVGHRGFGNWYSIESEIALGKECSGIVEGNIKLFEDRAVTEYVNGIGQALVRHSDAKIPFTIRVVDSDDLNAFSLPGGFLYVNYGVIIRSENEAELAGVMAHEVAHVAARHATRQMTRANLLSLASLPLNVAGGGMIGQAIQLAVGFAKPMEMLKFSRGFESEADYLGLEYLYAAGYDPQAFVAFLERSSAEEKRTGKWDGLFSTHPLTRTRIKKSQAEIARIFPGRDLYVVNTSRFDEIKAYLLALAGPHKAESERKSHEPGLRRRLPGSTSN